MTQANKWLPSFGLLVAVALIFGLVGYTAAPQPAAAQQIGLQDCTLLYAVQTGDTLSGIARRFNTTLERLTSLNNIGNMDRIFAGQVLCVSTSDQIIPETGGRSGLTVTDVVDHSQVTVQGVNFPANTTVVVQMLPYGVQNPEIIRITSFTIPSDGAFTDTFDIPEPLRDYEYIRIRISSGAANLSASTVFHNTGGSGVNPVNCSAYYTVRSNDTLSEIAVQFDTTVERLVTINDIADRTTIYPGQRLCVSTGDVIIPPTGGNASLSILAIDRNDDITLRGQQFPAGEEIQAFMGASNAAAVDFIRVATFTVPQDGMFTRTFNIPESLTGERNLEIRLASANSDFSISRQFQNAADGTIDGGDIRVNNPIELPTQPVARSSSDLIRGERETVSQGNAGVFMPASAYDGEIVVSRYDPSLANTDKLLFTQQLLNVQVTSKSGGRVNSVRGLVYVFFDITANTRQRYNVDNLAIYHYDPADQTWERCDRTVPINGDSQRTDRLSCIAMDFGLFGLAYRPAGQ